MSAEPRIQEALSKAGIPVCRMAWPVGHAPSLPWAVWYVDHSDNAHADDAAYAGITRAVAELYQKSPDEQVTKAFEDAITAAFGPFYKEETWVEDEQCDELIYYFDAVSQEE